MSNTNSSRTLAGKVALVTGGSRGIGAAIAKALADQGADVAVSFASSADKAKQVVKQLEVQGVRAAAFKADQADGKEVESLVKSIPRPEKVTAKAFEAVAEELFDRIMQMTDNAGAMDEHRACNYLGMRYPAVYATAADAFGRNCSLTATPSTRLLSSSWMLHIVTLR